MLNGDYSAATDHLKLLAVKAIGLVLKKKILESSDPSAEEMCQLVDTELLQD